MMNNDEFICLNYYFQNLRVERLWPEVNSRVNYPIKTAFIEMANLDMDDALQRFCCSVVATQVASLGLQRCVDSWNHHSISGEIFFTQI
jgi:hypothetical protein